PKYGKAHRNLADTLLAQKDLAGALTHARQAVALDPSSPKNHFILSHALLRQGDFAQARSAAQAALKRMSARYPQRPEALLHLEHCERLLALEKKWPDLPTGAAQPADAKERAELAELVALKGYHLAAARFFAVAFASEPKLARSNRYQAACSAILA